jgi:hypothetical protein
MAKDNNPLNIALLGMGAMGMVLVVSNDVFAKQFAQAGIEMQLREMRYDPQLQMMVDPLTGNPIYDNARNLKLADNLPTVTSSCGDCPKCDDDCG